MRPWCVHGPLPAHLQLITGPRDSGCLTHNVLAACGRISASCVRAVIVCGRSERCIGFFVSRQQQQRHAADFRRFHLRQARAAAVFPGRPASFGAWRRRDALRRSAGRHGLPRSGPPEDCGPRAADGRGRRPQPGRARGEAAGAGDGDVIVRLVAAGCFVVIDFIIDLRCFYDWAIMLMTSHITAD